VLCPFKAYALEMIRADALNVLLEFVLFFEHDCINIVRSIGE